MKYYFIGGAIYRLNNNFLEYYWITRNEWNKSVINTKQFLDSNPTEVSAETVKQYFPEAI